MVNLEVRTVESAPGYTSGASITVAFTLEDMCVGLSQIRSEDVPILRANPPLRSSYTRQPGLASTGKLHYTKIDPESVTKSVWRLVRA
jgi:hypothetical protein